MCFFMRTPYEEERSYYAQGQVESLNEYMTRTFLWMVLGLMITFGLAVLGWMTNATLWLLYHVPGFHLIVLAPNSVQEMHDHVAVAFDLAFKYRNPALILADGAIGQMMEKVVLAPQRPRKTDEEIAAECKSWATYGKPADRQRNIVTSLELQSEKMEIINKRLQEKYKALEENEVRYEAIDCDDADYVIVAFGSSAPICSASVEMARAEGLKVGLLRPITLYPFPKKPLAELAARGVKGFLSAELNAGQMVEDVRLAVNGAAPVEHFGRQSRRVDRNREARNRSGSRHADLDRHRIRDLLRLVDVTAVQCDSRNSGGGRLIVRSVIPARHEEGSHHGHSHGHRH